MARHRSLCFRSVMQLRWSARVTLMVLGIALLAAVSPPSAAAASNQGDCYYIHGQRYYRGTINFRACAITVGKLGVAQQQEPGVGVWAGWDFRSYHDGSIYYANQGRWIYAGTWRNQIKDVVTYTGGKLANYWSDIYQQWGTGNIPNNVVSNDYTPPNGLEGYDQATTVAGCELGTDNASYCENNKRIYYDVGFLKSVADTYGDAAAMAIIAHEWGHYIQDLRGNPRPRDTLSINREQQADCYAGAFMQHALDNNIIESFEIWGVERFFGDHADSKPLSWQRAHGSREERLKAFTFGRNSGADGCWVYAYLKSIVPLP